MFYLFKNISQNLQAVENTTRLSPCMSLKVSYVSRIKRNHSYHNACIVEIIVSLLWLVPALCSQQILDAVQHVVEDVLLGNLSVEHENVRLVLELLEMLLVQRPNAHLKVAHHVRRIVRPFNPPCVTLFVRQMKMELDVAQIQRERMVEDEEAFDQQHVQLDVHVLE